MRFGWLTALALALAAPAIAMAAETVATAAPACTYSVTAKGKPANLSLDIEAECRPDIAELDFAPEDRAAVDRVRTLDGRPAEPTSYGWRTGAGGLRYTVDLSRRVRAGGESRDLVLTDDTLMAPLDTWLGMPEPTAANAALLLKLRLPPGLLALHALAPADGADDGRTFRLTAGGLAFAGYTVFSTRPGATITVPGRHGRPAVITIHAAASDFAPGEAALVRWVRYFADLAAAYWQGFATDRLLVAIVPTGDANKVVFGRSRGGGGATLQLDVGRGVDLDTLYRRDWILTHELMHLAQPDLGRDGRWLMEGMATYVEPLLRHFAGLYAADAVWKEWWQGMPRGAHGLASGGLRRSNPYWSGALALLATNVAVAERTQGRRSLADAVRAGLTRAGNATQTAETGALVRLYDRAMGGSELADFVHRHELPTFFNLAGLWQQLGIGEQKGKLIYSNSEASARLRQWILSPPPGFRPPALPPEVAASLGLRPDTIPK
ncbi:MAG: hypothetical protein KDC18_04525 [Alphaproteobacteria bacterium]|nr:hypothetical protein [Alphaproteobacteria bacterium]MCB9930135.1 hypothetical protein [Alphaproteobacteria bacterium]